MNAAVPVARPRVARLPGPVPHRVPRRIPVVEQGGVDRGEEHVVARLVDPRIGEPGQSVVAHQIADAVAHGVARDAVARLGRVADGAADVHAGIVVGVADLVPLRPRRHVAGRFVLARDRVEDVALVGPADQQPAVGGGLRIEPGDDLVARARHRRADLHALDPRPAGLRRAHLHREPRPPEPALVDIAQSGHLGGDHREVVAVRRRVARAPVGVRGAVGHRPAVVVEFPHVVGRGLRGGVAQGVLPETLVRVVEQLAVHVEGRHPVAADDAVAGTAAVERRVEGLRLEQRELDLPPGGGVNADPAVVGDAQRRNRGPRVLAAVDQVDVALEQGRQRQLRRRRKRRQQRRQMRDGSRHPPPALGTNRGLFVLLWSESCLRHAPLLRYWTL